MSNVIGNALSVKLVSSVMVSEGDFPLALPVPDGLNNGGYYMPGDRQGYSPIDVLVAGLEAHRLGVYVTNLAKFFDTYRNLWSISQVTVAVKLGEEIRIESIAIWKLVLLTQPDTELRRVLKRNAPLTFKWS